MLESYIQTKGERWAFGQLDFREPALYRRLPLQLLGTPNKRIAYRSLHFQKRAAQTLRLDVVSQGNVCTLQVVRAHHADIAVIVFLPTGTGYLGYHAICKSRPMI